MCLGRNNKRCWSRLHGVYAKDSNLSHAGGKCVLRSGFTERWFLSLRVNSNAPNTQHPQCRPASLPRITLTNVYQSSRNTCSVLRSGC